VKKIIGVLSAVTLLAGVARADTIIQNFDTGQITPGSNSETNFVVNQFDTSLGTLTRVTFAISLDSWGGWYEVENITSNSTEVTGNLQQGIGAILTGSRVPDSLDSTLFAGTSKAYILPITGSKDGIYGPEYTNRNQTGPNTGDALSGDFGLYEGTGTYLIDFVSSQASSHTADGAVEGTFSSASSQGFLTVTYEYEAIPEPAAFALVGIGTGLVVIRRRRRARKLAQSGC